MNYVEIVLLTNTNKHRFVGVLSDEDLAVIYQDLVDRLELDEFKSFDAAKEDSNGHKRL